MKILFLSRWFPFPADNGSRLRILNIIKQLSRSHEVCLVSFREPGRPVTEAMLTELRRYCHVVSDVPYKEFKPTAPRALLGLLSSRPRSLDYSYSQDMEHAVDDASRHLSPDVVIASEFPMAPYALSLGGLPVILEDLELSVFLDAANPKLATVVRLRRLLTWAKLRGYLRRTLPRFAACTVVSETERLHLQHAVTGYSNVTVLPNAVEMENYEGDFGAPQSNRLIFCGALSYKPNYDAASYFVRDVLPRVRRAVPDVVLTITGSTSGIDLRPFSSQSGVEFSGYVPNVRPLVAQSWVSVVPLRSGSGTRLKIIESMALRTPVVSTSKGAEGLDVTDGKDVLLADDAEGFAQRVIQILRSPQLRARIAHGGHCLVRSQYNWGVIGQELRALVERVKVDSSPAARSVSAPAPAN